MFDDRLEEELRRALERPALASPQPAQARFRAARRVAGSRGWVGLAAFSAGAVATALVLATGAGSTAPRVWTLRAASVVTQLVGGTRPSPAASPSPSPTAAPPAVVVTPAQTPQPRSPAPSPEPTEKAGDGESGGAGGSGSGGQLDEPSPSPSSLPSPGPNEVPSPGSEG